MANLVIMFYALLLCLLLLLLMKRGKLMNGGFGGIGVISLFRLILTINIVYICTLSYLFFFLSVVFCSSISSLVTEFSCSLALNSSDYFFKNLILFYLYIHNHKYVHFELNIFQYSWLSKLRLVLVIGFVFVIFSGLLELSFLYMFGWELIDGWFDCYKYTVIYIDN